MRYRITFLSAPRMIVLGFLPAPIVGLAILSFVFAGVFPGIVVSVVGGYVSYIILRFIRKQLATYLETEQEGVKVNLYGEEEIILRWDEVTFTGTCVDADNNRSLFIYADGSDQLVVVPEELGAFGELSRALREKGEYHELELGKGETIKDRVKQLLEQK